MPFSEKASKRGGHRGEAHHDRGGCSNDGPSIVPLHDRDVDEEENDRGEEGAHGHGPDQVRVVEQARSIQDLQDLSAEGREHGDADEGERARHLATVTRKSRLEGLAHCSPIGPRSGA